MWIYYIADYAFNLIKQFMNLKEYISQESFALLKIITYYDVQTIDRVSKKENTWTSQHSQEALTGTSRCSGQRPLHGTWQWMVDTWLSQ